MGYMSTVLQIFVLKQPSVSVYHALQLSNLFGESNVDEMRIRRKKYEDWYLGDFMFNMYNRF